MNQPQQETVTRTFNYGELAVQLKSGSSKDTIKTWLLRCEYVEDCTFDGALLRLSCTLNVVDNQVAMREVETTVYNAMKTMAQQILWEKPVVRKPAKEQTTS